MFRISVVALLALSLGACAGRAPQLSPLYLTSDDTLSCDQILAEADENAAKMASLGVERNWKMGQNAVAGIVGFMAWPAWLGLDLQDAAGKEARTLAQRNEYLSVLAHSRCKTTTQTASRAPDIELESDPRPALASNNELLTGFVSQSH